MFAKFVHLNKSLIPVKLKFKYFLPILFAALCATADASVRSLVFDKGLSGSKYYRIPALAVASDGSLVAVADRRWDTLADLPGRIDVVGRRSVDGGATWSDPFVVAQADAGGGYGDPALGVDPRSGDLLCVMTHGNGLWDSTADNHAEIVVSRSADCGHTWSSPDTIPVESFGIPGYVTGFASSGGMCATSDGKIMFALVVRDNETKWYPLKVYAVWSDDGGHTWKCSDNAADNDGDESKIVELLDGRLLMSIRNRHKGPRRFSESRDGGRTWSTPRECADIIEPGCNGDILRTADGRLLQTVPADPTDRVNVSIFSSDDNGDTWRKERVLCPAPSSYSSMAVLPDGSLGVLIEEAASDGGLRIWFTGLRAD